MNKKLFGELTESLQEMVNDSAGKKIHMRTRTVELPAAPKVLTNKDIMVLRKRMNVSQAVFARYLNISVKTVQAWEQGFAHPSGASLKLLSIAQKDPSVLVGA